MNKLLRHTVCVLIIFYMNMTLIIPDSVVSVPDTAYINENSSIYTYIYTLEILLVIEYDD